MAKAIPLRNSALVALVDDEDYEWASQYVWHAHRKCKRSRFGKDEFYAARSVRGGGVVLMHRELMQTPVGLKTDHRNHDGLDNRRFNLRTATSAQNGSHTRLRRNVTGYRGVYNFPRADKPFIVQIMVERRKIHLGYFDTALAGALAYDEAAKKLHGEFATLNFP